MPARLTELVRDSAADLFPTSKDKDSNSRSKTAWTALTDSLHSEFHISLTVSQVRDKHKNLKRKAKAFTADKRRGVSGARETMIFEAEETAIDQVGRYETVETNRAQSTPTINEELISDLSAFLSNDMSRQVEQPESVEQTAKRKLAAPKTPVRKPKRPRLDRIRDLQIEVLQRESKKLKVETQKLQLETTVLEKALSVLNKFDMSL
ncbi:hypothetical protein M3Y96_00528800 [Aphelenchoides besseyi]|nr:hypothetical protein M3Y96_00528800 [Aphelenchoides besseyi]